MEEIEKKEEKPTPFLKRVAELENKVTSLEIKLDRVIKSLRR
jgi:exonuclease VII small subunit